MHPVCSGAAPAPSPAADASVLWLAVSVSPVAPGAGLDGVQGRVLGGQRAPVPEAGGQGTGAGPRGAPSQRGQVGAPPTRPVHNHLISTHILFLANYYQNIPPACVRAARTAPCCPPLSC